MSAPVDLPRRYRPFGARIATATAAAVLVAAMSFLWLMLPGEVQDDFTLFQRLTLLLFFAAVLVVLYGIFRMSALADDDGLLVVNGYRTHRHEWAELVRISLSQNRPWALIDLSDGTTVAVMAIQTADGERGMAQARELAALIAARSGHHD